MRESRKLVTAIETGYYEDVMRYAGEKFHVEHDARSTWFHAEDEEPLAPVVPGQLPAEEVKAGGEVDAKLGEIRQKFENILDKKDETINDLKNRLEMIEKLVEKTTKEQTKK